MALPTSQPMPLRPPLGLPTGSVRALLALILCGTLWYLLLNGRTVPSILADSALLVVAFYFGVRSTAPPTTPGTAARERQPLYLPRGVVRGILMAGFLGIIGWAWATGRPLSSTLLLVLQVLASYLVGFAIAAIMLRGVRAGVPPSRAVAALRNTFALAVLAIGLGVCAAIVTDRLDLLPAQAQNALAWTVAFYFGSRIAR